MFETLFSRLCTEISGVRAKTHVAGIARHHRIQASPGYDDALRYVELELAALGLASKIREFAADGKAETYGWVAPHGWTIRSGTLRQIAPKERNLCSYDEIPQAVLGQCPSGQAEGELVHIGGGLKPEDVEGLDLSGRFVLTTGRPMRVIRRLRGRDIAGLILYPTAERAAPDYDLVQYAGLFPKAEEIEGLPLAFSISRRSADRLLKELEKGPITVRGEVDAAFIDHPMRTLEAWIPGTDPEAGEVLLVAHLCHPAQSANDNASGSGLLVEVARALASVAEDQGLRNTVRLLWAPEFNGTIPWAAAQGEMLSRTQFVVNLDMVGQSPEVIGEPLRVFQVPNARASVLDACYEPILSRIAKTPETVSAQGSRRPLHFAIDRPSGGSDHLVFGASPFEIPALMLGHDDPYWHTDLDTIDKVDATRLKQVGILTAMLAMLPTWACDGVERLRGWQLAFSAAELTRAAQLADQLPDGAEARTRLMEISCKIEENRWEALRTMVGLDDGEGTKAHREVLRELCSALGYVALEAERDESAAKPRRTSDGPVRFEVAEEFTEEEQAFFQKTLSGNHGAAAHSLVGLCDGTRTVDEIALTLSLEFDGLFSTADTQHALELLAKAGCVEL